MHNFHSHSALARFFYDHRQSLNDACSYCIVSDYYIPIMALIAAFLKLLDMKRIMDAGCTLPNEMLRPRITPGKIISIERERDLALIASVVYAIVYVLLMFSMILDVPPLLFPWLMFQTFMIVAETAIFLLKLLKSELVCLSKGTLLVAAFAVYNWLQVFCHLRKYFVLCN